ncbi:vacuolar cation-chloride cotransporter 1 [Trichomonascus vanleenenianus]|uniref:Vhc1p n=1 Tax=Trichomonascus vanleenenianus TaxID=2268995 RepID=UPI003EC9C3AB
MSGGRSTASDFEIASHGRDDVDPLTVRQFYGRDGPPSEPQWGRLGRTITMVESQIEADRPKTEKDNTKLGTFSGVFIPTTLNVLSILMFLRFGFIIGQAGILGVLALLLLSFTIDLLTVLSISAISTNGTVRGGGAYYMISRSLGPEFGGSIGVVFYIGQILNTGLNVVGFFEPVISFFGQESGTVANILPESVYWKFFYATILLLVCTAMCTIGSSFFSKSGNVLLVFLLVSIISIPISVLFKAPYSDPLHDGAWYTGLSWSTIKENFLPKFTEGAAGSQVTGKENFQDMFGIFFPATSGIFAGASMSGDLRKPSKSIPKGTLWGLLSTFVLYSVVILSIGCTVSRELLHKDVQIIQSINVNPYLVLLGELSTSLYSSLMGVVGASKLLQAIARDTLLPFTSWFANGTKKGDNPLEAIILTWALTQAILLFDINQIAVFITMAYLMTFVFTNLACFLLKIASAPNFRPSFRFFNSSTAGVGSFACVVTMFVADGASASAMIIVLTMLFLLIHYVSPPKPWGDVSQSLIYHQVRKYLLRLRQDHVKFWRPQILLLVDNPRTSWSLMHFCNHLKKGGLYIIGHVVITKNFHDSYPEIKKQKDAWEKLRTMGNIKGFVQIGAGPDVVWGARNVYIGSGLGGMRPNITVMGFFEKRNCYGDSRSLTSPKNTFPDTVIDIDHLPTDGCRKEPTITVQQWVHIIEDLLTMQANIAIAKGFPKLQFPGDANNTNLEERQGYIDLYPIQMSAHITDEHGKFSALTTNFDTYTLILQMGAILRTVPAWKRNHTLRVIVFVEFAEDLENEKSRIGILLEKLRIKAEVVVLCLSSGQVPAYDTIIHGKPDSSGRVNKLFGAYEWWNELQAVRAELAPRPRRRPSFAGPNVVSGREIKQVMNRRNRRHTLSSLQTMGVSLSIQANHLSRADIQNATSGFYDEFETDVSEENHSSHQSTVVPSDNPSEASSRMASRPSSPLIPDVAPSEQPDYFSGYQFPRPAPAHSSSSATAPYNPHHTRTPSGLSHTVTDPDALKGPFSLERASSTTDIHATTERVKPTRPELVTRPSLMKTLSRTTSVADLTKAMKLKPSFSGLTIPKPRVFDDADNGCRTIMFEEATEKKPKPTPKPAPATSGRVKFDERTPLLSEQPSTSYVSAPKPVSPEEDSYLSFNDLPARAQHIILNDLMRTTSQDSAVIFSTLPPPVLGTHESEADSLDYVESLELWCADLPPIVLLHSQSMTVTTAL